MSEMLQQLIETATARNELSWLSDFRSQTLAQLKNSNWPAKRMEHWIHSPTARIEKAFSQDVTACAAPVLDIQIPDLETIKMVFVDGIFNQDLSSNYSDEFIQLTAFSQANSEQQLLIQQHIGTALDEAMARADHVFADLNGALFEDGLFLYVPGNKVLKTPVHVVYQTTGEASVDKNQTRLLAVLGQSAQASIIEHFVSATSEAAMVNNLTELVVQDNATLDHYRISIEESTTVHIGAVHSTLGANAVLNSFLMNLGSTFKRTDIVVQHMASGSHCELAGLYLPHGNEHIDLRSFIEHRVPHCTTNEVFRGILGDKSRAVFNGRIHIHPQAQKTEANLSNKNLLLDQGAEIYTKPELEIHADDVKCSHGATVSQIQTDALFYMQSRGISRKEAEIMLSYGFINELVSDIKLEPLQEYLRPMLAKLFTKDNSLLRHLG